MFETQASPLCYLGLMLSRAGQFLVEMSLGGGDSSVSGTAARNYTNGMVNRLPFPPLGVDSQSRLAKLVENIVSNRRLLFTTDETARSFVSPIIQGGVTGSTTARILSHLDICRDIADQQEQIETIVDAILQLTKQEEEMLSELMGPSVYAYPSEVPTQETCSSILTQFMDTDSAIITSLKVKIGRGSRFVTKNAQMVDRKLELIAHLFGLKLQAVIDVVTSSFAKRNVHSLELQLTAAELFSYCLGSAYGRWDIRYATGERSAPGLSDPFAPLPVCPPGMLQNDQGLPAMPGDVPSPYPLRICWPGILVDDEGHPEDIECRVREAIQVIWNERAEVIEQEACEILGVRTLREYFRKPALFFADHLQRYSKSRRQAPIYWPLSTPSGSYTLWLYYHRLTDQTLYSCVNDFVDPKLAQVRDELGRLRQKSGRIRADEKELERLTDLEQELQDFRAELLRVAAFWKPNLNDGVQITAAPLWKLFQHKPWQKRLKEISEKLEAGEYDWAHLAYKIWPERVRDKCWSDKSLAIAHDLETLYVEPPAGAKKGRGRGK